MSSEKAIAEHIKNIMHDVREFNRVITANSEMLNIIFSKNERSQISLDEENSKNARNQILSLLKTAKMLSIRLDLIDFENNPLSITNEKTYSAGIFSKFEKVKKILNSHAAPNKIRVTLKTETKGSFNKIDAWPVFDILPFLILENSIKYATPESEVTINIEESGSKTVVKIESVGPALDEGESSSLFDKGFRGRNAMRREDKGAGLGLYFAKIIADVHKVKISANQKGSVFLYDGVPHAIFVVALEFSQLNV